VSGSLDQGRQCAEPGADFDEVLAGRGAMLAMIRAM
jgi:hypothetical protein